MQNDEPPLRYRRADRSRPQTKKPHNGYRVEDRGGNIERGILTQAAGALQAGHSLNQNEGAPVSEMLINFV